MLKTPVSEQSFTNLQNQDGPIYEEIPVLDSNYNRPISSNRPQYDQLNNVQERKDINYQSYVFPNPNPPVVQNPLPRVHISTVTNGSKEYEYVKSNQIKSGKVQSADKLTKNRRFFWILGGVILGVVILIVAIVLIVLGASKLFI